MHADPAFCSKAAVHAAHEDYLRQGMANHLQEDVQCVLDGMLFHPRTHAHGDDLGIVLDGDGPTLPTHEVRLGGGIENAFVFLTHLRYQFCLVSDEARKRERTRLVELFTTAINDDRNVPAGDLFDLAW